MSSAGLWLTPSVELEKTITVGARRATSAASCRAPRRQPRRVVVAGDLADRLRGEVDEPLVERDRVDLPDLLPLDLDALLGGDPVRGGLDVGEHVAQLLGLERALVERDLAVLVDDRRDARARR